MRGRTRNTAVMNMSGAWSRSFWSAKDKRIVAIEILDASKRTTVRERGENYGAKGKIKGKRSRSH
jgi:hypothetical protein